MVTQKERQKKLKQQKEQEVTNRRMMSAEELQSKRDKLTGEAGKLPPLSESDKMRFNELSGETVRQEEERKLGFQELTGSEDLRTQIKQDLESPPSLEPTPIGDVVNGELQNIGAKDRPIIPTTKDIIGDLAGLSQEQKDTIRGIDKARKFAGVLALAGAGASALGVGSAAAALFSSKVSIALGAVGVTALGVGSGFPGTDISRDKIDASRDVIQELSQMPIDYVGLVKSGASPQEMLLNLKRNYEDLLFHESRIKYEGNKNLKYRTDKEYFAVQKEIETARLAFGEAINKVENLAITGVPDINPEKLLFHAENLNKASKRF